MPGATDVASDRSIRSDALCSVRSVLVTSSNVRIPSTHLDSRLGICPDCSLPHGLPANPNDPHSNRALRSLRVCSPAVVPSGHGSFLKYTPSNKHGGGKPPPLSDPVSLWIWLSVQGNRTWRPYKSNEIEPRSNLHEQSRPL